VNDLPPTAAPLGALLLHQGDALSSRLKSSADLVRTAGPLDLYLDGDAPPTLEESAARFEAMHEGIERPYCLMVGGVQNAGKSTLTNLLVGEWVMPCRSRNVDAVLSRVCWAPEPRGRVYYLDGSVRDTSVEDAAELLDQANEELAAEQARIDYVEIGLPNPNLKTFVLVNTPGLNDKPEISERTRRFFAGADAILWVFNSARIEEASITGEVLDLCKEHGHKLVAVLNRADEVSKMGGPRAMDQVEARFRQIFEGCYSASFRLNAKAAVFGLGIHPRSSRKDLGERRELLGCSGYAELIDHAHATWFGHEQREAKLAGIRRRADAVRGSVGRRCDAVSAELRDRLDSDERASGDLRRLRRGVTRNRNRVNAGLRAVVEHHGGLLLDTYLQCVDPVARDKIDLLALLKGSKKVANEFQDALEAAVESRLPAETFAARLSRDIEACLADGWVSFVDDLDADLDLDVYVDAVVPSLGDTIQLDGPIGRVIGIVVRTALGFAIKSAGKRLVKQGLVRAIQQAVRAVVKQVLALVGKRFTLALMRSLGKTLAPWLWISAALDVNKLRTEVRDGLAKARADVRLELDGQRAALFELLYDAAVGANDRVRDALFEVIDGQLDGAERERACLEESLEALAALRQELDHTWTPVPETP